MTDPYIYQCPIHKDYYDPLAVRRALVLQSGGQFETWLAAQKGDADTITVMEAHEKMLPVIRAAFSLPPIDRETGAGVPDSVALDVLQNFLRWLEGKA